MRLGYGVLTHSTSALLLVGDGNVVFMTEKTYHIQIEYASSKTLRENSHLSGLFSIVKPM
jgi:hypothetical protein